MTSAEHNEQINCLKEILGFKIPLDGLMMMAQQRPLIDIIKLDGLLIKEYQYEGSMNDFIKSKFGDEGLLILENNLK